MVTRWLRVTAKPLPGSPFFIGHVVASDHGVNLPPYAGSISNVFKLGVCAIVPRNQGFHISVCFCIPGNALYLGDVSHTRLISLIPPFRPIRISPHPRLFVRALVQLRPPSLQSNLKPLFRPTTNARASRPHVSRNEFNLCRIPGNCNPSPSSASHHTCAARTIQDSRSQFITTIQ